MSNDKRDYEKLQESLKQIYVYCQLKFFPKKMKGYGECAWYISFNLSLELPSQNGGHKNGWSLGGYRGVWKVVQSWK